MALWFRFEVVEGVSISVCSVCTEVTAEFRQVGSSFCSVFKDCQVSLRASDCGSPCDFRGGEVILDAASPISRASDFPASSVDPVASPIRSNV